MGKMSRKEKKLAKKTLNTMQETKFKEQLRLQAPTTSYKRKISYTTMPWPLELVQMGRKDVLFLIMLVIVTLIVFGIIALYLFINWVWGWGLFSW